MHKNNRIRVSDQLTLSPIIHGQMRLPDWNLNTKELNSLINNVVEIGITSFDHADIYGNFSVEKAFGDALDLSVSLRSNIEIITKCGIIPISSEFPSNTVKHYDYSFSHIVKSAENSLKNLRTDYIDLFLLHRPSPFVRFGEIAKAFNHLESTGMVKNFGVSNFNPMQIANLQKNIDQKIVANQVEISPFNLSSFDNGTVEHGQSNSIHSMAWSPLGGGKLFDKDNEHGQRILGHLNDLGSQTNLKPETLIYTWLFSHPSKISSILGSGNISRLKEAFKAIDNPLSLEEWFQIFEVSRGQRVP